MARLIFITAPFATRTYQILAHRTSVGRGDQNTLSIPDGSVSQHHAEIYDNGADLIIRDLGSRNGTVVNGELLHNAQRPLAPGQTVRFGRIEAKLEIITPPAADIITDVTAIHFHARNADAVKKTPVAEVIFENEVPPAAVEQTQILPRRKPESTPAIDPPRPPATNTRPEPVLLVLAILAALVLGTVLLAVSG